MDEDFYCELPFSSLHIGPFGDAYCCCKLWCNSYQIGNIFESTLSEIWYGEKVKKFRQQFIDGVFKYCQLGACIPSKGEEYDVGLTVKAYPKNIVLSYDHLCNIQCIFCRKEKYIKPVHINALLRFEKSIDEWVPDIFKGAQRVTLQGSGEALSSKHSRKVIKKVSELFPNVKFDIISNGLLFDKENLSDIGILDKLGRVSLSIHAVTKNTYNKIVKHGDFDRIMRNLKFIHGLLMDNKIESLELRFVITTLNYKEMIKFAKLAQRYSANVTFLKLIYSQNNKHNFDKINILNSNHPEYNQFVDIVKHPIFKEDFCFINDQIVRLKKVSFLKSIKNKFKYYFQK